MHQRIGNDRDATPIAIGRPSHIRQGRGENYRIPVGNSGLHQGLPGLDPLPELHELGADLIGGLLIVLDPPEGHVGGGEVLVHQFELHSWFQLHECAKSIPGDRVPLPGIGNPLLDPRREGAQLVHVP